MARRVMIGRLRALQWLAAALAVVLVSCTSGDGPSAPTIESTTFAPALGVNLAASTRTASGLYYRDVMAGSGTVAASGNQLTVHYTGSLANGQVFDSNLAPAAAFGFTLGVGQVIVGWDQGVAGMRVGGRRQLIIPPDLGYGSSASGPIPGNSILVFTVDLVSVR